MTDVTTYDDTNTLDRPLGSVVRANWYTAAWVVLIVLAIVTRFYDLGARVISHDESLHTYYSWKLANGEGFTHTPLMHGPFQFHALALSYTLFGDDDFTSRIPSVVFGIAAIAMLYFFRRWLGNTGALLAGVFLLVSPYILYYSRYVRNESFVVLLALLMAYAMFKYFEDRRTIWLVLMAAAVSIQYTVKETSFIYVALWMVFLGLIYVVDMWTTEWRSAQLKRVFQVLLFVALALTVVFAGVHFVGDEIAQPEAGADVAAPANPEAELPGELPAGMGNQVELIVVVALLGVLAVAGALTLFDLRERLREFASVDLLVLLGTTVLPQLTAFPVVFLFNKNPLNYTAPQGVPFGQFLSSDAGTTLAVFAVLFALSAAVGLAWDWKRWLIVAGVFYGLFIPFYTTIFTNGGGFWTGAIGSLGYWLEQQEVARGNQPWYYYIAVQVPVYEFLALIGTLVAAYLGISGLVRWLGARGAEPDTPVENPFARFQQRGLAGNGLPTWGSFPVLLFIGFWAIGAVAAYTIAGEKMPWLTVHITLPMLMLAGWAFGQWFDRIDWQALLNVETLGMALTLPLVFVAFVSAIGSLTGTNPPFQGSELNQLQATSVFLLSLAVLAGGIVALVFLSRQVGVDRLSDVSQLWFVALLTILSTRAAFFAAYINYDYQTEYINYASGAPGIRTVLDQVEEISIRLTDGTSVRVAYDDDTSWPLTWYLRHYNNQVYYGASPSRDTFNDTPLIIAGDNNWNRVEPILGERYYQYEYIRMWWPMQEYFGLNSERITSAIGSPDWRAAIWDIWWQRDYSRYGELNGVDYSLSRWPVVDRMRFYVRKDVGAQLWELGVGPTIVEEPLPEETYNNHIVLSADLSIGVPGSGDGQFNQPRGVAVGPDGSIYVADTDNHRIQKFGPDGNFVLSWGRYGNVEEGSALPGTFNQPWNLTVDNDGNVLVVDTWNHRVQKFTDDGEFLATWGYFGTSLDDFTAMWGPRDIAVDAAGNIYVTDTGNKRVSVFDSNGNALRSIGFGGVLAGELDEPVGLAVGADYLYVADTWNRRVQLFDFAGASEAQWPVAAWYGQSLENKPYIAVAPSGEVFISDPEGFRIVALDATGEYLFSFGDFGSGPANLSMPVGVALDDDGRLWVVDTSNNRVQRFDVRTLLLGDQ